VTDERYPLPDADEPLTADELLDALPYGVVAVEAAGIIVRGNATARALVPGLKTAAARRCHDLFACQAPEGPCERGCLVARVARTNDAAPEIRIDAAGGAEPGALWVTASPLPAGGGAILHLRAGARGDRRRRSGERWQTAPELRIFVLGRTHVESLEDSLETKWLSERPGQILKYLVSVRTRAAMVDEIAEAIWPDKGLRAINSTRYTICQLRLKLEPRRSAHQPSAFVLERGGGYSLDRGRIWIDADEFELAVQTSRAAMARLDSAAATSNGPWSCTAERSWPMTCTRTGPATNAIASPAWRPTRCVFSRRSPAIAAIVRPRSAT